MSTATQNSNVMVLDYTPQTAPPVRDVDGPPAVHYLNNDYGWLSWLLTVDHKRIGILYLVSVSIFFVLDRKSVV